MVQTQPYLNTAKPRENLLRRLAASLLRRKGGDEENVPYDATFDRLTGLPDRNLFMRKLMETLGVLTRDRTRHIAVFVLDLDRFKVINDSLGHTEGDALLVDVAQRLSQCLRGGDILARLGGDEFGILVQDIGTAANVAHIADRIARQLTTPFMLSDLEVFVTASIGIAVDSSTFHSAADILRAADIAMYRAKGRGPAGYEVYEPAMKARAWARLQVEADLRHALERHEFMLDYQPIVNTMTGIVSGVEALVRWLHPTRGLISPLEFIPVAEETNLIIPLGEWVLRTACAQLKNWSDQGLPPIYVTVNLSPRQFSENLVNSIRQVLADTGVEPRLLKLELTEGSKLDSVESGIAVLEELAALGVQLFIDDFGTGYPSLSYLVRFPVSTVKIDQSFIREIATNPDAAAIASAITAVAHRLNLTVVAEGVETDEQLAFLRAHECDAIQGYIFSRPLAASAVATLLQQGAHLVSTPS